ncbi:MAG: hypothetical protein Q9172_005847 [Xanthocarpia lactea]
MTDQSQATTTLLSNREVAHIVAAFQSLKDGEINLDWDKFVALSEYSTVNSARSHFSGLKKKLSLATTDNYYVASTTNGTPNSTPRKPRGKGPTKSKADDKPTKRKDPPTEDNTPSKRSKKVDAVKQEVEAEETEETPPVAEEEADD